MQNHNTSCPHPTYVTFNNGRWCSNCGRWFDIKNADTFRGPQYSYLFVDGNWKDGELVKEVQLIKKMERVQRT